MSSYNNRLANFRNYQARKLATTTQSSSTPAFGLEQHLTSSTAAILLAGEVSTRCTTRRLRFNTPVYEKLLLILALLFVCSQARATTYFIRHNGGTNVQCTGTTNAAYPGSGTGVACAYNHPFQMVSFSGTWIALTAGDTVQFADPPSNTTPYYMGEQNGGLGTDWSAFISTCPVPNQAFPAGSSCFLPVPPDNTTWIGQNAGNCHTAGHTGLVTPTILSGINGVFAVMDVQGTTGVSLSCIEMTQPDNCSRSGVGSGGGCSNSANFISTAGLILEYLTAQGPRNLTMTDIAVDGTAVDGILGSHLNTMSGDVITGSDIYLIGNGHAGWNSDGSGCGTSCESIGTMNLSHLDVEGNGCVLLKPFDVSHSLPGGFLGNGSNSFDLCFGQNTGGYGDGFVLIAAGAFTVNIDHSIFKYNTQDGFDGLHISDDTTSPITNISTSWSEGNAGAAFKFGVGVSVTDNIINNVGIGNCRILTNSAAFPDNPPGWITLDFGDSCRAAGDQWSFQLSNGSILKLENNSMAGYGTTMLELGCGFFFPTCGSNGASVIETNDAHVGYPDAGNAGRLASGWNLEGGTPIPVADHNSWFNMDSGCPDDALSGETNWVCPDPLWVGESNVDALNPNLTGSSPLIGAGITISGITTDYNGNARPNPPAIGAFEPTGASTVATPTFSPGAGSYGPAQSVTISTATGGASIVYTTDGSNPAVTALTCTITNGTLYGGPVTVSTSLSLKAIGCLAFSNASSVGFAPYVINGAAATPTFTPPAGSYSSTQSVILSTSSSGCGGFLVWNTTNAQSGGNLTGTSSTNPLTVATSETVYAQVQGCPGWLNSSIGSAVYTITPLTPGVQIQGVITFSGQVVIQ